MKEKLHRVLVVDDDTRLRNLLGKYLNDNEAKFYFSELACALHYLHRTARVIHRYIVAFVLLMFSRILINM